MQETELHDLSDDSDYAASIHHGSASLNRSGSSKRSSESESDGAEVVYLKENVAVHPTQYSSERINGRLRLIKQGSSLFMTWIPYKGQNLNARLSDRDRNLYTIRAVPFTDVRSICRHAPPIGWQYIIVVLSSGLAFPPLYFYNGGVREFLATVKQHIFLVRSAEDSNVFLVNDFQDRLQRTLSSLELPRTVSANVLFSAISFGQFLSNENQERNEGGTFDGSASHIQNNGRRRQKVHSPARDLPIKVLEKFSRVTRLARETTSHLFRDSHSDSFGANERENHNQTPHGHPSDLASNDVEKVSSEILEASDPLEVDKLTLWGKPRQPPLGAEEWLTFFDSEGRIIDSKSLRKRVFYGGVDHRLREEVWPFLLGYHAYDSTYAERQYLVSAKKSEYETIKNQWQLVELLDSALHNHFKQNDCLNYFFCFRWLLIQFKREFDFDKTMRLWEVLWTHYLSEHLHLYFCIGILKRYRPKIIAEQMDFDTLLKFINELSGQIDLEATLRDAEALCVCAGENGAAIIPPGTPPSLPIEDGVLYPQLDDDVL